MYMQGKCIYDIVNRLMPVFVCSGAGVKYLFFIDRHCTDV